MTRVEFEQLVIEASEAGGYKAVRRAGQRIRDVVPAEKADAGVFLNIALMFYEIEAIIDEIVRLATS